MNERQIKVLNQLLDWFEGKLTTRTTGTGSPPDKAGRCPCHYPLHPTYQLWAEYRHANCQPCVVRGSTVSLKPMAWITLNSVSELGARSPDRLL